VLGKFYYKTVGKTRLYGGLGLSARRTQGRASIESVTTTSTFLPPPHTTFGRTDAMRREWIGGFVVALGIEASAGRFHVSPELRHTHWPRYSGRTRRE
jgi:hypothetical protein